MSNKKNFEFVVAEYHQARYTVVGANSLQEAIDKYNAGEGELVDDSTEFVSTDETRGFNSIISVTIKEDDCEDVEFNSDELKEKFRL